MKRIYGRALWLLGLAMVLTVGLTSCDDDPYYWGSDPYGWNFQDSRLQGYWQLVQYNSDPVPLSEANYMYFNGRGGGYFFYMQDGYRETEQLRYNCQNSVSGASNYQINIRYQYSSPLTTSYWFTHGNNTLWMQWQTQNGRVQTYVYDRINNAPW